MPSPETEHVTRSADAAEKKTKQQKRVAALLSDVIYSSTSAETSLKTVMVSYFKPGSTIRNDQKYRIDERSTIEDLRRDAARYWKEDQEEFVRGVCIELTI
jgi:hypothetical protein